MPLAVVTVTVAPGSPMPEMVGVESLVDVPSAGTSIAGGAAVASTKNSTDSDTPDRLPAGSTWLANTVWPPSDSARSSGTSMVQVPSGSTVAVPIDSPSTNTSTVAPISPVPVMVGVWSATVEPAVGSVTAGGAGASVSIVKLTSFDGTDSLPAGSIWVALTR